MTRRPGARSDLCDSYYGTGFPGCQGVRKPIFGQFGNWFWEWGTAGELLQKFPRRLSIPKPISKLPKIHLSKPLTSRKTRPIIILARSDLAPGRRVKSDTLAYRENCSQCTVDATGHRLLSVPLLTPGNGPKAPVHPQPEQRKTANPNSRQTATPSYQELE